MSDFEKKYGNFSFDSSGVHRSSDDTRGKLDELMNDEELKEALRKMKGEKEEKSYVAPGATAKDIAQASEKGYDIEDFIDKEAGEKYPEELRRLDLECIYIGLLLNNPAAISMYYFVSSLCLFADPRMINIYKGVLFTEGEAYAPAIAKENFNFATESGDVYALKNELKKAVLKKNYDFEKIYTELRKIFILRKAYNGIPIKEIKDKVAAITKYELYDQMTSDEVEAAIEQITATAKFKSSVLNTGLTSFIVKGNNSLTNGLQIPFRILSQVFKGVRLGETMAFAMPSNSGKSRFTTVLAAYIAFIHKKKVLIISNEMSEEKVRLCLATTIINNAEIQNLHGQKIRKTENELLEFKYRADNPNDVKVDEDGFVIQEEGESHEEFVNRLTRVSSEFNKVTAATDWLDKEIKRTATILSNLAQNLGIFICSSLQLTETATLPVNLTINDLAVSRTVKEVLDTLMLIKQIHNENLGDYEYSEEEVDTKYYDLERFKDPNVRYYACVVDKNRAGPKPKVVFRLNLAYNEWFELGYLRLKAGKSGQ